MIQIDGSTGITTQATALNNGDFNSRASRETSVIENTDITTIYRTASDTDAQLRGLVPAEIAPDNAPLEIKKTDFGVFLGTEHLLFPELGIRELRIFTGVEQALLESLIRQPRDLELAQRPIEQQPRFDHIARKRLPANISISGDGGCMIVEGV